jgi:hypothetical protein
MADASANPRAIAVGFCRHPEREHASDLFAAPATELRGAAATVDPWGGTVHPPLRLLVCGVLLGFVHAAPGAAASRAGAVSVAACAGDWRRSLITALREIRSTCAAFS